MEHFLCKFKRALTYPFHPRVNDIKVQRVDLDSMPSISTSALANKNVDVIQNSNSKFFAYVTNENKVKVRTFSSLELQFGQWFELINGSNSYKSIALSQSNNIIACLTVKGNSIHFYEIIEEKSSLRFSYIFQIKEKSQIKIFRWHPTQQNRILIVSDDNSVKRVDCTGLNKDWEIQIGSTDEDEIINADWCLNGQYMFVSTKKKAKASNFNDDSENKIQIFKNDNSQKEEIQFFEKRNNNVVMLEYDKIEDLSYLLSFGTKSGNTKYCLYELNHKVN